MISHSAPLPTVFVIVMTKCVKTTDSGMNSIYGRTKSMIHHTNHTNVPGFPLSLSQLARGDLRDPILDRGICICKGWRFPQEIPLVHHSNIHTSLLATCRQIDKEVDSLPLRLMSLRKLIFRLRTCGTCGTNFVGLSLLSLPFLSANRAGRVGFSSGGGGRNIFRPTVSAEYEIVEE